MAKTLGPDDKKKIKIALRTISEAWTRVEAERSLVKNTKKDLCKELDLDRKTFTKVAKLFHKQNLDETEQEHADMKSLFKQVVG